MDRDGGEVVLFEDFIKLDSKLDTLHKDDHLVEHEGVEQVGELSDFLVFLQFDIVLLESVQGELALVVNEDLEWVLHELPADLLDVVL